MNISLIIQAPGGGTFYRLVNRLVNRTPGLRLVMVCYKGLICLPCRWKQPFQQCWANTHSPIIIPIQTHTTHRKPGLPVHTTPLDWYTAWAWGLEDCHSWVSTGIPHIDGLVQDCSNSSALAMELRLSCTNSSIDGLVQERCNSSALAMELRFICTYPLIWPPVGWLCEWLIYVQISKCQQLNCSGLWVNYNALWQQVILISFQRLMTVPCMALTAAKFFDAVLRLCKDTVKQSRIGLNASILPPCTQDRTLAYTRWNPMITLSTLSVLVCNEAAGKVTSGVRDHSTNNRSQSYLVYFFLSTAHF